jgi:hypothetical protein
VAQAELLTQEVPAFPAYLRWSFYTLLIAITLGAATARVMQVQSASRADPSPFLSANDKSRWATVRALVDHGTYAIDDVIFKTNGQRNRAWHSIDIVRHRGPDGKWHYYSSKPTLLPTLLAGQYWLIQRATGATLEKKPFYVARLMLVLTNVLPLGLALAALAALAEKYGATDWGRLLVVAAACGGTYLTTFVVALNNHLPAAVSVALALACLLPICWERKEPWWRFFGAGLFSAFAAACELPALAFFAAAGAVLLQRWPRQTLLWFVPPALLVAAGAVGTNYLAHGTWKPPYAMRQDGPVLASLPTSEWDESLKAGKLASPLREALSAAGVRVDPESRLEASATEGRWVLVDPRKQERYAVVRRDEALQVRRWENWYEFEGSYWSSGKLEGVDRGEASVGTYVLHCLVGHHGLFSLTPIWLVTLVGLGVALAGRDRDWQGLAAMVLVLSAVVLAFYFTRPQIDRNYGGVTCCLRWALWLTPLWLVAMLPAADWAAGSRSARWLCLLLLAISAFSATYSAGNPFSHPWLFEYWEYLGWIRY